MHLLTVNYAFGIIRTYYLLTNAYYKDLNIEHYRKYFPQTEAGVFSGSNSSITCNTVCNLMLLKLNHTYQ